MMSAARTSNVCGEVDSGGWDYEKERRGRGIVRVFPHIQ